MNMFPGILYIVDNIDNIMGAINANPYGKHVVLNLSEDESSTKVGDIFRNITQDATILCPPPGATYMEIDGNMTGFKDYYSEYLYSEEVKRFILLILYAAHNGVNVYMYIPEFTDESLWIGLLLNHFKSEYGIDIGMVGKRFIYDQKMIGKILYDMYMMNMIDPFEFISFLTDTNYIYPDLLNKLGVDLVRFGCEVVDPFAFINQCKQLQQNVSMKYNTYGLRVRPAIIFE